MVIRLGYQVLYQKGITKLTFVQLEYTMWQMPAFSYDLMNARPVHHDLQPTREKMQREKKTILLLLFKLHQLFYHCRLFTGSLLKAMDTFFGPSTSALS